MICNGEYMYLEDFREIVEKMVATHEAKTHYTNKLREVDLILGDFVIENRYTNLIEMENEYLLRKLLGENLCEDVFWFIYDWKPGYEVGIDNVTYKIEDINSYMSYINNVYKLPMKPKIEE